MAWEHGAPIYRNGRQYVISWTDNGTPPQWIGSVHKTNYNGPMLHKETGSSQNEVRQKCLEWRTAICDGLNNEDSLAQKFTLSPQTISAMVQTLLSPTPYCGTGLLMADMTRLGGSTVEHARNIRLTPE